MKREKRIENGFREGALLKTGELLVVLHSLKRRYSDALVDFAKSIKTKIAQFYRYRQKLVSGINRVNKHHRVFRHLKTKGMSGGLSSAKPRPRRLWNLTASSLSSGKSEVHNASRTPGMVSPAGISEPGRCTVEPGARTPMASIVESTALHSGIAETACYIWIRGLPIRGESWLPSKSNCSSQKRR